MTYEQGFSDGERAAFSDRKTGFQRSIPETDGEYWRGFFDGYTPRSSTWARGISSKPVIEWWRESEAA